MSTTTDLSEFTHSQLQDLCKLLQALAEQGLPKDFYKDNVTVMLNTESDTVFLTNDDYQVALVDSDGKLKSEYYLGYSGHEGFIDELYTDFEDGNIDSEDWDELADICERNDMIEECRKIRKALAIEQAYQESLTVD